MRDQILGCILGGAIGDAFGRPYETLQPPIVISEAAEWRLSDDTQLTLATCEAITSCNGSVDVAGGHWALVGGKGERAASNGAAMRAAPLAFCLDPNDEMARRTIRDVSRITHHNEEAYAGALAVVVAVRAAASGLWDGSNDLLRLVVDSLPDTQVRDRLIAMTEVEKGTPLSEMARRFGCSGYVAASIPLALCGASRIRSLDFKTVLIELIACGGDTDTNASIAGQVAGALIGRSGLPEEMIARTPERRLVEAVASSFAESLTL